MDLDIILGILIFFQVLFGLNIGMPSFSRNAQSSKISSYNVVRSRSATEKFIVIYFVIRQLLNKHLGPIANTIGDPPIIPFLLL